jgi:hypothetical protein
MQLDLDTNDINVIVQSLEQGPFRVVAPVLMKLQAQVMAQQVPTAQAELASVDEKSE